MSEFLDNGLTNNIEKTKEIIKLRDHIFEVYGDNGANLYPSEIILDRDKSPLEAEIWVLNKLAEAKLSGKMTALVSGAFDVPQDNHDWFLRHCRMTIAEQYLKLIGEDVNVHNLKSIIKSDKIFMIVNIDSDEALNNRKSNDPTKGGAKRPIYGWSTRANRIASHNFQSTEDDRVRHGIVDLVIAEGPEYQGTMLERARLFAKEAKSLDLLDHYIVFDENPDDLKFAQEAGFIDSPVIPMALIYAHDPISGQPYKSSCIIKRIRSNDHAE